MFKGLELLKFFLFCFKNLAFEEMIQQRNHMKTDILL